MFKNMFLLQRSMNDSIFLGGMKHGSRWAAKTGLYCGTFMLVGVYVGVVGLSRVDEAM